MLSNAVIFELKNYATPEERVRPSCITDIIYSGESLVLKKKKKKEQFRKNPKPKAEQEIRLDGSVLLEKDGSRCERCGYLSTNKICKACVLLEGLEKSRAKIRLDNPDGAGR